MSDAASQFAALWSTLDKRPVWTPEHRFAPPRRWRFDFAYLDKRIAVEIEGLQFGGRRSRHTTAKGYMADCEKYNQAAELGWLVLRYTQVDLRQRPVQVIEQIQRVIETRTTTSGGGS